MANLAQNNGTNNMFVNLSNAVTEQHENRLNEFTEILNAETEVKTILTHWRYDECDKLIEIGRKYHYETTKTMSQV